MCVQYIGGYHEYTGGCSVHWGVHKYIRGGHEYIGEGFMSTSGDVQYIKEIP